MKEKRRVIGTNVKMWSITWRPLSKRFRTQLSACKLGPNSVPGYGIKSLNGILRLRIRAAWSWIGFRVHRNESSYLRVHVHSLGGARRWRRDVRQCARIAARIRTYTLHIHTSIIIRLSFAILFAIRVYHFSFIKLKHDNSRTAEFSFFFSKVRFSICNYLVIYI